MAFKNKTVIDQKTLETLKNSLGDNADNTLKRFLTEVEALIDAAVKAHDQKDFESFRTQCHKIKSSVGYLGSERLQSVCLIIEGYFEEGDLKSVEAIGSDFESCSSETLTTLKNIIET